MARLSGPDEDRPLRVPLCGDASGIENHSENSRVVTDRALIGPIGSRSCWDATHIRCAWERRLPVVPLLVLAGHLIRSSAWMQFGVGWGPGQDVWVCVDHPIRVVAGSTDLFRIHGSSEPLLVVTNLGAESFDSKPEQRQILLMSVEKRHFDLIIVRIPKGLSLRNLHAHHGRPWPLV